MGVGWVALLFGSFSIFVAVAFAASIDCDFSLPGNFCGWIPSASSANWRTASGSVDAINYNSNMSSSLALIPTGYHSYAIVTTPFGVMFAFLESPEIQVSAGSTFSFYFRHWSVSYDQVRLVYIPSYYKNSEVSVLHEKILWSGHSQEWDQATVGLTPEMGTFKLRFVFRMEYGRMSSRITGFKLNGTIVDPPGMEQVMISRNDAPLGLRPDLCVNGTGFYTAPDCMSFVKCDHDGGAYASQCPGGFVYDPLGRRCDVPAKNPNCLRSMEKDIEKSSVVSARPLSNDSSCSQAINFSKALMFIMDGKPLPESIAIARFAARETGLAGKDNFESARIDALVDYLGDAQKGLQALRTEPDEKKKAALKEEYIKVGLQPYLQELERHLEANNNGKGFLFGSEPTWADFALTVFVDNPAFDTTLLDNFALLNAHHKRVHELKPIKEWLQKHSAKA
ncbi:hypothetical protein BV898_15644 [Hypsibius exemplaris]|uniref:glutathione transferase n=1 Tax=Hypsibius exemplaris TaxID=2072580 RepID=A0A9X6ND64_HYPEX|nr:hypothetical protein BV898_15644 [Hypsibius exemplaris]